MDPEERRDDGDDGADVFVSYAHADNSDGWIDALVSRLDAYAKAVRLTPLRIFLDRTKIRTMEDWELRIWPTLRSSTVLLPVISPKYLESPWCRREWENFRLHELDLGTRAIAGVYGESVPGLSRIPRLGSPIGFGTPFRGSTSICGNGARRAQQL